MSAAKLVLASSSPRRRELLSGLSLDFEIQPSDLDESSDIKDPVELVAFLALAKAKDVAAKISESETDAERILVLGADTVVALGSEIMGKPQSREEAYDMLMRLSGTEHKVFTGVAIVELPSGRQSSKVQSTSVFFRKLKTEEAWFYASSDEPMDKAGAYALQGTASAFIDRVEGCYTNVIGLPVSDTVQLLREFGVKVMGV